MPTKITVAGVQGSGKSCLCYKLMDLMVEQRQSVCLLSETTHKCPYTINENATSAAQDWLWHDQIRRELVSQREGTGMIIVERSLMDHVVYLKRIVDKNHNLYQKHIEDKFEMLHAITKEWMTSYDYVVRLPLDLDRLQSGNNPIRSRDITFAKEIDSIFDELLTPYVNTTEEELFAALTIK